jgi:integrase
MRRVCKEAEIDLDGEHDYLTPHGGRRGAGDVLYRKDPVLAQTALRHRSIETTKHSYSYIEAGETATRAGDVFDADHDDG